MYRDTQIKMQEKYFINTKDKLLIPRINKYNS